MEQLVDIFLELEKHPLEKIGSTVPADVRDRVGGFAQAHYLKHQEKTLGPFSKPETAYRAMITGVNERHWQQRDYKSPCR